MKNKHEILLETGTNEVEIAEFGIYSEKGGTYQSFGINVAKVREIIPIPYYLTMPNSHSNIVGIFTLRDKVIPLIDLGAWLNYQSFKELDKSYIIVTEFDQDNFGFIVHKIETIHRMSWEKVLPPVDVNYGIKNNCITGIVTLDEDKEQKKIMMMIDFERIVADINPEASLSMKADHAIIEQLDAGSPPPKVLLAEDSTIMRDLLSGILEKGGFDVIKVNNGKKAWEHLQEWKKQSQEENKELQDIIQLVLTDIEMPQMDGHSLTRKIKEDTILQSIPVILFSSLIYEEIRRKGEVIGADAQISKPEIGNLLNIVEEVLEKKKAM